MARKVSSTVGLLFGVALSGSDLCAQAMLDNLGLQTRSGNGFHIYSATASSGYSSLLNAFDFSGSSRTLGSDVAAWGSLSTGFTRMGPRGQLAISYVPTYSGRFRYGGLHSLNQNLVINAATLATPKLTLFGAAQADYSTAEQFVFQQGPLTRFVTQQPGLDQMTAAAGAAASADLPALQAALYGARLLTVSASGGLSYRRSTRLTFTAMGTAADTRARADESRPASVLIPRSRMEQGSFTVSYSLSTKTQVSTEARTTFVRSSFSEYQTSVGTVSIARKFGRRWFFNGGGGVGIFNSLGASVNVPGGSTYVALASVGFRALQHTFIGSFERNIGDVQGLASESTSAYLGSWSWRQRGLGWSAFGFGGHQTLRGSRIGDIQGWQGSMGLTRSIGRQTQIGCTYAYMTNSLPIGTISSLNGHSIRASITWIPFLRETPPLNGGSSRLGE